MERARDTESGRGFTHRERLEHKEEVIVEAAYSLFTQLGYAKTTMAEIARESGVAEGTVYLYFSNKDALARAVLALFYQRLTESAQRGVDELDTTFERLSFLGRHHLNRIIDQRRLLEIMTTLERMPETYRGSELFAMNKAYVAVFDRVAREGVNRGELEGEPTLWVVRDIFFGALHYGARTIMIKKRRGKDVSSMVDKLVRLVMRVPDGQTPPRAADEMAVLAGRFEAAAERIEAALQTAAEKSS